VFGELQVPLPVVEVQVPLTHVWPSVQRLPHEPQLLVLLVTSVHTPLQSIRGEVHDAQHMPSTQLPPSVQRLPHEPQLLMSKFTSTQLVPHMRRGAVQRAPSVGVPVSSSVEPSSLEVPSGVPDASPARASGRRW
jgi:hypothetical protein